MMSSSESRLKPVGPLETSKNTFSQLTDDRMNHSGNLLSLEHGIEKSAAVLSNQ